MKYIGRPVALLSIEQPGLSFGWGQQPRNLEASQDIPHANG
jgi:hypothetical protein